MSADFVPLFAAGKPAASAPAVFNPMPKAVPTPAPAEEKKHGEVKVEIVRQGDGISVVRVHCRCGEVIELECEH